MNAPWGRIDRSLLVMVGGVCGAIHVGKLPPALPALREALEITLVQAGFLISMVPRTPAWTVDTMRLTPLRTRSSYPSTQ